MDEYIKRETLLTDVCNDQCGEKYSGACENCRIIALIADTPAADVVPVVHGNWIWNSLFSNELYSVLSCSHCGELIEVLINRPNYCPNCGAKMDGEAE